MIGDGEKRQRIATGGDQTLLRRINASVVLATLHARGARTVSELVSDTELSRPTVVGVLSDLVASGWTGELPPESGGMGRPARRYRFRAEAGYVLGIDIGAHKLLAVVSDLDGNVVAQRRVSVEPGDVAEKRVAAVKELANRTLRGASVARSKVSAVGVGVPGVVDPTGRVTATYALPEALGLVVHDELASWFSCPILVDNDATLAAVAERWRGAAQDVDELVYVLVGRRLGSAILLGGRPYRGRHGAAGEIAAADFVGDPQLIISLDDAERAQAGDAAAVAVMEAFTERLVRCVVALTLTVDPELVIVGGGLARASEHFLPRIAEGLESTCVAPPPRVALSAMGDESVALGAVRIALDNVSAQLFSV